MQPSRTMSIENVSRLLMINFTLLLIIKFIMGTETMCAFLTYTSFAIMQHYLSHAREC